MTQARKRADPASQAGPGRERRTNLSLREAIDELILHIRTVNRTMDSMSTQDLEYAQQRLLWLADELWRIALEEDLSGE